MPGTWHLGPALLGLGPQHQDPGLPGLLLLAPGGDSCHSPTHHHRVHCERINPLANGRHWPATREYTAIHFRQCHSYCKYARTSVMSVEWQGLPGALADAAYFYAAPSLFTVSLLLPVHMCTSTCRQMTSSNCGTVYSQVVARCHPSFPGVRWIVLVCAVLPHSLLQDGTYSGHSPASGSTRTT